MTQKKALALHSCTFLIRPSPSFFQKSAAQIICVALSSHAMGKITRSASEWMQIKFAEAIKSFKLWFSNLLVNLFIDFTSIEIYSSRIRNFFFFVSARDISFFLTFMTTNHQALLCFPPTICKIFSTFLFLSENINDTTLWCRRRSGKLRIPAPISDIDTTHALPVYCVLFSFG